MEMSIPSLPGIGDLIGGRFRVLEVLGTGGFGTVYRAVQENIGREVALKFLTPAIASDPINVERFRREAYHVSQLRHPNTITVFDYGQTDDGLVYMVLELLRGHALSDVIQDGGEMEWPRVVHVYSQILKSLTEAHQHGLVHRDLKPENIHLCEMFGEKDFVKVLDFGVAKMTLLEDGDGGGEEQLTKAGRIFGTPMYMAPEQACAEPITPATDVYALGLLLFEMKTGLPPVSGRNRMDVIHKQIRDRVPVLTPDIVGTPMAAVIEKACEKLPHNRYANAAELLVAFMAAAQQMKDAAGRSAVPARRKSDVPASIMRDTDDDMTDPNAPMLPPEMLAGLSEVSDAVASELVKAGRRGGPPPLPVLPGTVSSGAVLSGVGPIRAQTNPRYELPLIGRDGEFAHVTSVIEDAVQRQAGCYLLVEGEGGIGKTHLMQSVGSWALERGGGVSQASFRRRSQAMEAFRELLAGLWGVSHSERMQADRIVRGDLQELGGFTDGEISRIVEFMRPQLHGDADLGVSGVSDSGALFARLERLLLRLAERRPLILILDDVQFADSASLAFLEYFSITLRTHAAPIVVSLLLRPEDVGLNSEVGQSLRTMHGNLGVGFARLGLKRLQGREFGEFLDSVVLLEARLKERIAWLSQGVPLHAMQIIRYLQNENNLVRRGNRWVLRSGSPRKISLPPDLMELMGLRVGQAIARRGDCALLGQVAQWLAVLGMRVPMELLAAIVGHVEGMDLAMLEAHVGALCDEGIVRRVRHQNIDSVEFSSSLLRESILRDLSNHWSSRRMHAAAAQGKATFYGGSQRPVPLVEIADHWRQAGEPVLYRDALYAACRRSMGRFDLRSARDQFRELAVLLEEQGDRGDMWADTQLALAELARRFGEFGLAEEHYRRALEPGGARGREKARALRGFGHLLTVQCRYQEALQNYRQALDWSQQIQDVAGIAKAFVGISRASLMSGDVRGSEQARWRLESMAGSLQEADVRGQVSLHLAEAAQRRGQLMERYEHLVRARESFEISGDRQGLSDSLIMLAGAMMEIDMQAGDRYQRAEGALREALEIKRSIGDRHGVAEAFRHLGQLELERNNFEVAEGLLMQSLTIHQALGAPYTIGATYNGLGLLNLQRRHYGQAAVHFERAGEILGGMGDELARSQALLNKGINAINLRDMPTAQEALEEAWRIKYAHESGWALSDVRNHLAIVAMWYGNFELAESLLTDTLAELSAAGGAGTGEERAMARSLLGLLRCFQQRLQQAALELGRAHADAEELNVDSVTIFCQANAAFYSQLTKRAAPHSSELVEVPQALLGAQILHTLDREIWLELLENMAIHAVHREKSSLSNRLIGVVGHFWSRFGHEQRGEVLVRQASELEPSR